MTGIGQLHSVVIDAPDLYALDEAEPKVLALGAHRLAGGGHFRVYADPVGHPFCLVWDA